MPILTHQRQGQQHVLAVPPQGPASSSALGHDSVGRGLEHSSLPSDTTLSTALVSEKSQLFLLTSKSFVPEGGK